MTQPTVNAQMLAVLVTVLPLDHPDAGTWGLRVEWRGGDQYAVVRYDCCLSVTGEWDPEPNPSSRDEAWTATHRFSHQAALALAAQHAPHVRINGVTATEVLTRIGAEGSGR